MGMSGSAHLKVNRHDTVAWNLNHNYLAIHLIHGSATLYTQDILTNITEQPQRPKWMNGFESRVFLAVIAACALIGIAGMVAIISDHISVLAWAIALVAAGAITIGVLSRRVTRYDEATLHSEKHAERNLGAIAGVYLHGLDGSTSARTAQLLADSITEESRDKLLATAKTDGKVELDRIVEGMFFEVLG